MSDEQENDAPGAAVVAEPPAELTPGQPQAARVSHGKVDLELLMDVQVTLSVEVGRTRLPIKELLALNEGAVVSLDRGVNDPLDLMVNGTLIARGEVVESGGRFGLRLIEVVSPSERLKKLK
ncbi:MAG: flagellar motor switch protein FliN/FliY [Halieaceae bacterium]|jgi:flagellar motor switch protein FliN/FliY